MLSTILYVALIIAVFLILSSIASKRIRGRLPLPLRRWSQRISDWMWGIITSTAEAGPVRVGDVLVLAGLIYTLLTIFSQLKETNLQASKENLEVESRRLNEVVATQEQDIRDLSLRLRNLQAGQTVPQLKRPDPDANIIGSHVDLQWDYRDHNPNTKYVVEIVRISDSSQHSAAESECAFQIGVPCRIVALDPVGERSRLPLEIEKPLQPGSYYWRVIPGELRSPSVDVSQLASELDKNGEWSAFGNFTMYPTLKDRILRNRSILVGTNFVQDTGFSRRGRNGAPEGYDIDLVSTIVQGCLDGNTQGGVSYNKPRCDASVLSFLGSRPQYRACTGSSPYLKPILFNAAAVQQQDPPLPLHLKADIVPVAEWKDWLGMLQRKEIDLFIGQATRAQGRERGDVKFTNGYFTDATEMLVKETWNCDDLTCFAKRKVKVGVIAETTNHWLANLLVKEENFKSRMQVVTVDSFPALESAMDHGDVDAIIIDHSLGSQLMLDHKSVKGLEDDPAFKTYLHDESYIGFGKEEFAIAVASDTRNEKRGGVDLLGQIQHALDSDAIKGFIQCVYAPARK